MFVILSSSIGRHNISFGVLFAHIWVPMNVKKIHISEDSPDDERDYVVHGFTSYTMNNNKYDKYFTCLPMSLAPGRTSTVLMQVDCGATCNTLPSELYDRLCCLDALKPSRV